MPRSGCAGRRHREGLPRVPELPEVETVRRNVERTILGKTIVSVAVRLPKLVRLSPIPELRILEGARFIAARRRAKVLILDTDAGLTLMIHFKLSGQLAILESDGNRLIAGHPVPDPAGSYPHKTTHVDFAFDDGTIAHYSDVRQFGWMRLMETSDVEPAIEAFRFGPEGYGAVLDSSALSARLKSRNVPIKVLLLDQKFIAGLGNIYVDEALYRARIHPTRLARSLPAGALKRLFEAIPWSLAEGIKQGGARIVHQRAFPIDGFPAVHGREGEACAECGSTIVKARVGGRGTYFCPRCQRPPRAGVNHPVA